MPRSLTAATLAGALLGFFALPNEAHATVPCGPTGPCHNNFAEPIVMYVLGSDAFGFGLIGTIGNAATLGRGTRAGTGWLTIGYFGGIYNAVLGATWTALASESLARFPTDSYATMQLGMGVSHLALSAITLGVTGAAHARRGPAPTPLPRGIGQTPLVPLVVPVQGGASVGVAGQF